jgi:hypothetical protein
MSLILEITAGIVLGALVLLALFAAVRLFLKLTGRIL